MIENMSVFHCPNCGHEAHIFGHGGARADAERLGIPFLGEIPLDLDTRIAGDNGTPIAATDSSVADIYAGIATRLIEGGMA
jgi:ATP-binding protein involved in chromosome partitioning